MRGADKSLYLSRIFVYAAYTLASAGPNYAGRIKDFHAYTEGWSDMGKPAQTMSVRFDPDIRDRIKELADRNGQSASDFVRSVIREKLEGEGDLARINLAISSIQERLAELESKLGSHDENLRQAAEALLVVAAEGPGTMNKAGARAWVKQKLTTVG